MKKQLLSTLLLPIGLVFTGCYVEAIDDDHDHYSDYDAKWDDDTDWYATSYESKICKDTERSKLTISQRVGRIQEYTELDCNMDMENERIKNCEDGDCNGVPIYTHYMLSKKFEGPMVAYIEAFDNPRLQGQPKASVRVENFKAEGGHWQLNTLILAPGDYYLRSYLTNNEDISKPYQFGDLNLIAGQPVGHFGAMGTASMITVPEYPRSYTGEPVNIYLDKLFESESNDLQTNAFLRVRFHVEVPSLVPDNRNILVQLRAEETLEANPLYEFKQPSESLLVAGREGSADFISPELEISEYFLFAFIDLNDNGFYDQGELAATHRKYSTVYPVSIKENSTISKSLDLKAVWQLEEN